MENFDWKLKVVLGVMEFGSNIDKQDPFKKAQEIIDFLTRNPMMELLKGGGIKIVDENAVNKIMGEDFIKSFYSNQEQAADGLVLVDSQEIVDGLLSDDFSGQAKKDDLNIVRGNFRDNPNGNLLTNGELAMMAEHRKNKKPKTKKNLSMGVVKPT